MQNNSRLDLSLLVKIALDASRPAFKVVCMRGLQNITKTDPLRFSRGFKIMLWTVAFGMKTH